MADLIRDAPLGQLIRWATKNRHLQYPEEKADFKLPQAWQDLLDSPGAAVDEPRSSSSSTADDEIRPSRTTGDVQARLEADELHNLEKKQSIPIAPKQTKDGTILVDWYYSDDSEDPHNWSNRKRLLIAAVICLYTFVVYTSSAIYTSSIEGIRRQWGVGELEASLGLSLYVLGYGVGPLVFSPLSEIPRIGRSPVYAGTMFLFVIISIPTAFAPNFAGLMVLRFLQGFFGSPCLASGGASLGDMYSLMALPYAMVAWVSAAYCGRESRPPIRAPRLDANPYPQPPWAPSSAASPSPSRAGAGRSTSPSGPRPPSSSPCSSPCPRRAPPISSSAAHAASAPSLAATASCPRARSTSNT